MVPRSRFPYDRIYRSRERNLAPGVVSTFEYHNSGSRSTGTGRKGQLIVASRNEPPS